MMSDLQEKMAALKSGQIAAACESCNTWLTPPTDSATLNSAIAMHRKNHEGDSPVDIDGKKQVKFPITVIYKVDK